MELDCTPNNGICHEELTSKFFNNLVKWVGLETKHWRNIATHIRRFKTLSNQKQYSNHASDLVPQESTTFDFHRPELIGFKPVEDEKETEMNRYNQIINYMPGHLYHQNLCSYKDKKKVYFHRHEKNILKSKIKSFYIGVQLYGQATNPTKA